MCICSYSSKMQMATLLPFPTLLFVTFFHSLSLSIAFLHTPSTATQSPTHTYKHLCLTLYPRCLVSLLFFLILRLFLNYYGLSINFLCPKLRALYVFSISGMSLFSGLCEFLVVVGFRAKSLLL